MAFSPETYGAVQSLIEQSLTGAGAIKGQDGAPGKDGKDGADGKSAYEVAVDEGFEGTEEEWLQSLTMERTLSLADYKALSEEEKNNGVTYYIDDVEEDGSEESISERVTVAEQNIVNLENRATSIETKLTEQQTFDDTLTAAATYICDNLT